MNEWREKDVDMRFQTRFVALMLVSLTLQFAPSVEAVVCQVFSGSPSRAEFEALRGSPFIGVTGWQKADLRFKGGHEPYGRGTDLALLIKDPTSESGERLIYGYVMKYRKKAGKAMYVKDLPKDHPSRNKRNVRWGDNSMVVNLERFITLTRRAPNYEFDETHQRYVFKSFSRKALESAVEVSLDDVIDAKVHIP